MLGCCCCWCDWDEAERLLLRLLRAIPPEEGRALKVKAEDVASKANPATAAAITVAPLRRSGKLDDGMIIVGS